MNRYSFIGNLTADPVKRATQDGKVLATFAIAINEKRGETEYTTFVNCTAWERQADPILRYGYKGQKIYVEGKPSARPYKVKSTGEDKASLDVKVERYEFLSWRSDADDSGIKANDGMTIVNDDDCPF